MTRRPPALIVAILMQFRLFDNFKYAIPMPTVDVPGRDAARMGPCLRAYYAMDKARKQAELIAFTDGKVVYRGVSNEMKIEHDEVKDNGTGNFTWMDGPTMAVVLVLSRGSRYDVRYTGLPQALRDGFNATVTIKLGDGFYSRVMSSWKNLQSIVSKAGPSNIFDRKNVIISTQGLMFVFQVYLPP